MSSQKRKDLIHPQRKQAISVGTEQKSGFSFSLSPSRCPPYISTVLKSHILHYCDAIKSVLRHHRSDLTGHYVEKRAKAKGHLKYTQIKAIYIPFITVFSLTGAGKVL